MNKPVTNKDFQVDWTKVNPELAREGKKIVLPNEPGPMSIPDSIDTLKRIQKAEEAVFAVNETVNCHFFDGLVALARAMKQIYGYSLSVPTPGFFGDNPPQLVHVKTGPKPEDYAQVPFGRFKLPNVDGFIATAYGTVRGIPVLRIGGEIKHKHRNIVMELVKLTKKFSQEHSIYTGRSIVLRKDESGGIDFDDPLEFIDPFHRVEEPIFNRETEHLIDTTVLGPIAHSDECRAFKIPLKRGILFEGPYGCGKSLTARHVARCANANGWTFVLVDNSMALKYALDFAKMYQPCVVFAEDIDRIAGNRNEGANDLLNMIDGVVGKSDEIITLLTTNFVDKIEKGFLRPGRLDAVISIQPPDKEAAERLVRAYAGNTLDPKAKLDRAVKIMAGNIPATIREVVERSKLSMVVNGRNQITGDDLYTSALSMQNHLDIIEKARASGAEEPDTVLEQVGKVVDTKVHALLKKLTNGEIE